MSAAVAAAAAAALANRRNSAPTSASTTTTKYNKSYTNNYHFPIPPPQRRRSIGRYELQKSQDWDTFDQYLKNHHHHHHGLPVSMWRCSGAHVVEFLRYLDQFGETKIHNQNCASFGQVYATAPPCSCPLKQAWTSLDAVVGRLRVAFEEHGGVPENNPFGSPAVWLYLRRVKEFQAQARGVPCG